jgi:hypothetical protein
MLMTAQRPSSVAEMNIEAEFEQKQKTKKCGTIY